MKIFVTGGAGFIGSHVVDSLVENNHEVLVVDNLSTGNEKNLNEKAEFYKLDINSSIVEEVFKANLDVIIHLAAQVSVAKSHDDPTNDAMSNITGSLNLIQLAKRYDVKKFIYINSAAIFGNPQSLPIDETHPRNPESNYGLSKNIIEDYLKLSNLNFVSLRLSNVYGPRQRSDTEGGVVSIFAKNLLNDKEVNIYGDGEQTRDFIYVKDVVKAIICSMETKINGIFNIGTGQEISINNLFQQISNTANNKKLPNYLESREGDIQKSIFSIKKSKEILDWEPEISLNEGIKKTVDYEKNKI